MSALGAGGRGLSPTDPAVMMNAMRFRPGWGSTMPTNVVQDVNRALARKIIDEARADPQSPYTGKFVGIANGRVVVVADDADELARRLRQAEPDVSKTFALEVGLDYDAVQEIWRVR